MRSPTETSKETKVNTNQNLGKKVKEAISLNEDANFFSLKAHS